MTELRQSREIEIINGTKICLSEKKHNKITRQTKRNCVQHVCALFVLVTHYLVCPMKQSNLLEHMMCLCSNARNICFYDEYSLSLRHWLDVLMFNRHTSTRQSQIHKYTNTSVLFIFPAAQCSISARARNRFVSLPFKHTSAFFQSAD